MVVTLLSDNRNGEQYNQYMHIFYDRKYNLTPNNLRKTTARKIITNFDKNRGEI